MSTSQNASKESFIECEVCHRKVLRTLKCVISKLSFEPTIFFTLSTSIMYQLVVQNLYLEKACRVEIKFNESICEAMTTRNNSGYTQHQETEVQKLVSLMLTLRTVIQGSFPLIVVIFAGSWSDRYNRRKPLIMIPIIGEIICCLFLILNSIFFYELPLIFTTLGDSIPFSLSGGWPCFNIGVYSYVGAKYKDEEKTFRVGIVTATCMSALLLGSSAGGFIYQQVGFIGFFSLCAILLCIGLVIGYFTIHDEQTEIEGNEETTSNFKQLLGVEHLISTVKTGFKSGPNKRRCKILVCMVTFLLASGTANGEVFMNYMYTRLKFAWNAAEFAVFVGFQLFVQILGAVLGVVFFTKLLKIEDTFLGIISMMGSIISNFVVSLASSELLIYIGACCDTFQMCGVIALRSLVSKIVPPNELGQTISMLALVEALIPIIFGTIYATVYQKTIEIFPGTYFFVSAGMRVVGLGFFFYIGSKFKDEEKTLRIGIVSVTLMSALLLGSNAGGSIYQKVRFIGFFSICTFLFLLVLIFAYFKILDEKTEIKTHITRASLKYIFGFKQIIQTFKTTCRNESNRNRYKAIVVILSLIFSSGPFYDGYKKKLCC